ncbi:hypothetical protein LCGC14_2317190, partial [marine sediment metagenome]
LKGGGDGLPRLPRDRKVREQRPRRANRFVKMMRRSAAWMIEAAL